MAPPAETQGASRGRNSGLGHLVDSRQASHEKGRGKGSGKRQGTNNRDASYDKGKGKGRDKFGTPCSDKGRAKGQAKGQVKGQAKGKFGLPRYGPVVKAVAKGKPATPSLAKLDPTRPSFVEIGLIGLRRRGLAQPRTSQILVRSEVTPAA